MILPSPGNSFAEYFVPLSAISSKMRPEEQIFLFPFIQPSGATGILNGFHGKKRTDLA